MSDKINPKRRRRARYYALQALFQWHFAGGEAEQIQTQFIMTNSHVKTDWEFFREVVTGVLQNITALDEAIAVHTDRPFEETSPIERALLRLGAFELKERIDVPYRVVLNEYVELAKTFGVEGSHAFVNGVLDKLAHLYRAAELNSE